MRTSSLKRCPKTELKLEVFARIDRVPAPYHLCIEYIGLEYYGNGGAKTRPERFIGMHFQSRRQMKLVEIVRGLRTSDETCRAC
jgi:3-hydroxyacyl-CoA dehydrogenase